MSRLISITIFMSTFMSTFILLAPPAGAVPENYENCRLIFTGREWHTRGTRIVNGYPVYAAAWSGYRTYECDRKNVENECRLPEEKAVRTPGQPYCVKRRQNCIASTGGFCDRTEERWRCYYPVTISFSKGDPFIKSLNLGNPTFNPDKQAWLDAGLTLTESRFFTDPTYYRLAGKNTTSSRSYRGRGFYGSYSFSEAEIETQCPTARNPNCTKVEGSLRRSQHRLNWYAPITGQRGYWSPSYWRYEIDYSCRSQDFKNDCGELENDPNCTRQSTDCLSQNPQGECEHYIYEYKCGENRKGGVTQICGTNNWCINDDCTDVEHKSQPNQNFGRAAAAMNVLQEMGKDFRVVSADDLTIFGGQSESCSKSIFGLKNCCKLGGFLVDNNLAECNEEERLLAVKRNAGQAHYTGSRCARKTFFGACLERQSDFCTFKSRLGRIIHEQGRAQLGIGWNSCRGFTDDELGRIDWSQVDLTEVLGDIEGRMTIPEANNLKTDMQDKINTFYSNIQALNVDDSTDEGDDSTTDEEDDSTDEGDDDANQ
jgi:hypothetical protein